MEHHKAIYRAYREGEDVPHYIGKVDRVGRDTPAVVQARLNEHERKAAKGADKGWQGIGSPPIANVTHYVPDGSPRDAERAEIAYWKARGGCPNQRAGGGGRRGNY